MGACGSAGTARKCSSLVAFAIRSDSAAPAMILRVVLVLVLMWLELKSLMVVELLLKWVGVVVVPPLMLSP